MIRAIIFDCFGVLVHGSLAHLRSLAPPEQLASLNDLSSSSDYGFVSRDDYLQGVGELLGRSSAEIADIIAAQYVPNQQMIDFARSLRGEYKVAMLSNVGRDVINRLFTAEELDSLFDTVILSSEIGMVKPHADIYEFAARQLDLTPEECLMIDDAPVNITGASSAGMPGIICSDSTQCLADIRLLLKEQYARTT